MTEKLIIQEAIYLVIVLMWIGLLIYATIKLRD